MSAWKLVTEISSSIGYCQNQGFAYCTAATKFTRRPFTVYRVSLDEGNRRKHKDHRRIRGVSKYKRSSTQWRKRRRVDRHDRGIKAPSCIIRSVSLRTGKTGVVPSTDFALSPIPASHREDLRPKGHRYIRQGYIENKSHNMRMHLEQLDGSYVVRTEEARPGKG